MIDHKNECIWKTLWKSYNNKPLSNHKWTWCLDLYMHLSVMSTVILKFFHSITLRWRHNERDSVSNHQPQDCLLNRLFRRRSKKTSKLRVTGLCVGNSPGTAEFPAQMASYAEIFPFDDVIMILFCTDVPNYCIMTQCTDNIFCTFSLMLIWKERLTCANFAPN